MASPDQLIVGTGANETGVGSRAWSNPGNVTANDNTDATTPSAKNFISNRLKCTMTGNLFSIPSGATIDGIVVQAEILANVSNAILDYEIKIVKGGTGGTGTEQSRGPTTFWPTGRTLVSWGGVSDKWGLTWSDTDINAGGFGVGIVCQETSGNKTIASVDYVQITVYYTEAGGTFPINEELTTGVTTSQSVTKTAVINESLTSGVTTDKSITKTTAISESLTTGVTTDPSVTKETEIFNSSIAFGSTDESVTVTKNVSESLTTGVTTDESITKTTSVSENLTTGVTTTAEVTKVTEISEGLTTAVTTDNLVQSVKPVEESLTTAVTTDESITKVAPIPEELTTAVATSASVTKITDILESFTTAVTTSETVQSVKPVNEELTTGVTTSASVTKITDVLGSFTTAVTTDESVVQIPGGGPTTRYINEEFTTAVTTDVEMEMSFNRIFSETVTAAGAVLFSSALVLSEGCSSEDILQADNYAPLADVKPDSVVGSFSNDTLSTKLVPMRDDNTPPSPPWYSSDGRGSTFWQSLDADVDGTDQTEWVKLAAQATPGGNLVVGLSSVPATYGTVTSLKVRYRITGDMSNNNPGDISYLQYFLRDGRDDSLIASGFDVVTDLVWDNEVYEFEATGLSLDPLTVNAMELYISNKLNSVFPVFVGTNLIYFWAADIKVFTPNNEKIIPTTEWTDGEKAIAETQWDEKVVPVAGWGEKEIPSTGWTAGEKEIK